MHPLLTIAVLWLTIGVASLLTAIVLHTLLPIGPFLAAGLALLIAMAGVLGAFLGGREPRIQRNGE